MSDIENAIQKLEEQAMSCNEEYTPALLAHLKEMAQGLPDVFLQDNKNFKDCIEFVFIQLQFKALENCLKNKSYIALPNGAGTEMKIEINEICELAENYYFLSEEDIQENQHESEFRNLMKQLQQECREKENQRKPMQKPKPNTASTPVAENKVAKIESENDPTNDLMKQQICLFD